MVESHIIVQLRDKLKRAFGSQYKSHSIVALTGDASDRKYFRIQDELSNTQIVCWDSQLDSFSNFLTVQKFLLENSIPVPRVHQVDGNEKMIILQDLGDITLSHLILPENNQEKERGLIAKLYREILDSLICMQKISVPSAHDVFNSSFFNNEKFLYEVGVSHNYYVRQYKKIQTSVKDEQQLLKIFERILTRFEQGPYVFVHRDFHSRNIMSLNNQHYFIDFQDARLGPIYYDLASLLDDCYFQLPPREKESLLKYYYEYFVVANLPHLTFDAFLKNYYLMCIQRIFKALGSFSFLSIVKNKNDYLQYIAPNEKKLRGYIDVVLEGQDRKELLHLIQ